MKHYVVFLEWSTEGDNGSNILGVVHSPEEAKEIFKETADEERALRALPRDGRPRHPRAPFERSVASYRQPHVVFPLTHSPFTISHNLQSVDQALVHNSHWHG